MTKTPFDHVKEITTNQDIDYFDTLSEEDKKSFNVYIVNLALSMNSAFLPAVNELNKFWNVGSRETYLYYSQLLPKGKTYNKWIKSTMTEKFEPWLVEKIASHYETSKAEAIDDLTLFYKTELGKEMLYDILRDFGISKKELKKIGLEQDSDL